MLGLRLVDRGEHRDSVRTQQVIDTGLALELVDQLHLGFHRRRDGVIERRKRRRYQHRVAGG